MASPTGFKIKGLKRWKKALEAGGFDADLRKNIALATALNGQIAEAIVRKAIQSGGNIAKNAALTVAIKQSSKALVDSGLLFQSVTSKMHNEYTVFVGVLRSSRGYNVAKIVTEGAQVKVTPRMRSMFAMLAKASKSKKLGARLTGRAAELYKRMQKGWFPLKRETQVIVIPGRDYFKIAFSNTQMIKKARDNWKKALEATLRDVAQKSKGAE